jgi:hypothetical protein
MRSNSALGKRTRRIGGHNGHYHRITLRLVAGAPTWPPVGLHNRADQSSSPIQRAYAERLSVRRRCRKQPAAETELRAGPHDRPGARGAAGWENQMSAVHPSPSLARQLRPSCQNSSTYVVLADVECTDGPLGSSSQNE